MALSFSCDLILPDTNNKYHSSYNDREASSTVTFITFDSPLKCLEIFKNYTQLMSYKPDGVNQGRI